MYKQPQFGCPPEDLEIENLDPADMKPISITAEEEAITGFGNDNPYMGNLPLRKEDLDLRRQIHQSSR